MVLIIKLQIKLLEINNLFLYSLMSIIFILYIYLSYIYFYKKINNIKLFLYYLLNAISIFFFHQQQKKIK